MARAPGVDEIRPEMLKALGVEGLSWLTRLINIAWKSGAVLKEWQTGVVVPLFKKGDQRVCANYRGITLLSLPGKYTLRCWKGGSIVEPQIEEEQCGFRPGRGTTDQLFTLARILEGAWEYAYPVYMCFVDLEKAYDRVPREILWEVLREYRVRGPYSGPSNLCTPKARAVSGFSAVSRTRSQWGLASARTAPCHLSCL